MKTFISKNVLAQLKQGNYKDSEFEKLMDSLATEVALDWPALLNLLDADDFVKNFPPFTSQDPLYQQIIIALEAKTHPELLEHLFDQLFVESLNWVRSQTEVDPNYLAEKIRQKQTLQALGPILSKPLLHNQKLLFGQPYPFIHDLIFFLAWDRVCINLAILFEYPSVAVNVKPGLVILRNCLIESFQHIMAKQETTPSFFRFIEALYAYEMREEHLQSYSDREWITLCESAQALRSREEIIDVSYIDKFIIDRKHFSFSSKVLTMDSSEKVNKSIGLARYMIDKLNSEDQNWHYELQSTEIICLHSGY